MRLRLIPVVSLLVLLLAAMAGLAIAKAPGYETPVKYTAGANSLSGCGSRFRR